MSQQDAGSNRGTFRPITIDTSRRCQDTPARQHRNGSGLRSSPTGSLSTLSVSEAPTTGLTPTFPTQFPTAFEEDNQEEDVEIVSSDEEEVYGDPNDNSAGSTSGDFQELDEAMEEFLFDRLKLAKEISETHGIEKDNNLGE